MHQEIEKPFQINAKTKNKNIDQEYNNSNKSFSKVLNTENSNFPTKQKSKFFEHNITFILLNKSHIFIKFVLKTSSVYQNSPL